MSEVASAYITLIPSARGFGKRSESILNGELGSTGEKQGKNIGSRMAGSMGKALKYGAVGVGAVVAGVVTTGLAKGFSRLKGIENAQAKLAGLGHSTKSVTKIMENALTAVKGTAFGLDAAATVAASAVAAGVKPGKELTRTLSLVGDAATIAGVGMDEMGGIFNKVAASNKIQGDVIAQLNDAGIPIIQLLGKELGKSAEETVKLASEGKVNFATFQNAMEKGLGGAAQESGKTFEGALANAQAALGRLGAKFLEGTFAKLPGVLTSLTGYLDSLGPHVETAAAKMGDLAAISWDKLAGLGATLQPLVDRATDLAGVGWGKIKTGIDSLKGLKDLSFEDIDGAALGKQLGTAVADGLNAIMAMVPKVTEKMKGLFAKVDWVGIGITIGKQVPAMLLGLAAGILAFDIGALFSGIMNNWSTILIGVLALAFAPAKLIAPLGKILSKIPFVGTFLSRAVVWFNQIGGRFLGFIGDMFSTAWRAATGLARFPGAAFVTKILGALKAIPGRVREFFALLGTRIGVWALDAAAWLGRGFSRGLVGFFKLITLVPRQIIRALGALGRLLFPSGSLILSSLRLGIQSRIGAAIGLVKSIPGMIRGAFGGAGSWLLSAGQNIIAGLRTGITSAGSAAIDAARAVASKVKDAVTGFFKIKSPSRVMAALGVWIPRGLAVGINKGAPAAFKAARNLAKQVAKAVGSKSTFSREVNKHLKWKLGGLSIDKDSLAKDSKAYASALNQAVKKALQSVSKQLKAQVASLGRQIDTFKSLRDGVRSTFSPDLFSAGPADFISGLKSQLGINNAVLTAFKKLKGMGLNANFLAGLMQSGNSDLITALAGAGGKTVKSAQKDWLAVQRTAGQLGTMTAEAATGEKLSDLLAEQRKANKLLSRLDKAIGAEVGKAVNTSASNAKRNRR